MGNGISGFSCFLLWRKLLPFVLGRGSTHIAPEIGVPASVLLDVEYQRPVSEEDYQKIMAWLRSQD